MIKTPIDSRIDPELDPLLEQEFYEEPPELKERLDLEEAQGSADPDSVP